MYTTSEKTVREIATENPSSIRVFESLGIDYCCGGKRSLSEACSRVDVPMNQVLDLLHQADQDVQAPQSGAWTEQPLTALMAHIVSRHHSFVRRGIPRLNVLLTKVVAKHGDAHPEVRHIEQLFLAIGQELSTHLMKEEQVLFPYIERLEGAVQKDATPPAACFGSVARPIANMIAEHDDAGALLARMRELSNGYAAPGGACPTFIALYRGLWEFERDLHQHIHLENNILFPRAVAIERDR